MSCLFTFIFFLFISGDSIWQQHIQRQKGVAIKGIESIAQKTVYIFHEFKVDVSWSGILPQSEVFQPFRKIAPCLIFRQKYSLIRRVALIKVVVTL